MERNREEIRLEKPTTGSPLQIARGELYLPETAYMRVLPFTVEKELSLRLEAIVFAADSIAAAYVRLVELSVMLASCAGEKSNRPGLNGTISSFQQAWSIVDHVHALRNLLPQIGVEIDGAMSFVTDFESGTHLRNRMDHLHENISNIAKSKGSMPGVYGSLTYTFVPPEDLMETPEGQIPLGGFLVIQQIGPVRPGQEIANCLVPSVRHPGISNLVLRAFQWSLNLDDVVLRLAPLITTLNTFVEQTVKAGIANKAKELGRPEADLSTHYGANHTVMLRFNVGS